MNVLKVQQLLQLPPLAKKKTSQSRFLIFRHIQVDPVCEQTPGFQSVCVNFIKTQTHSGRLGTDFPVQQHKLVLYVAFLLTQDYRSTISCLLVISHFHKLISLKDPCFLTIFGAKKSDYCPIQCLKNYVNQRREQDGPLII